MVTFPARKQDVQTDSRRGVLPTIALTLWMFGFHRRFMRRWEWLMLIPNDGCFPQISHTAATVNTPRASVGPAATTAEPSDDDGIED